MYRRVQGSLTTDCHRAGRVGADIPHVWRTRPEPREAGHDDGSDTAPPAHHVVELLPQACGHDSLQQRPHR
jgi:hypothetical protein